MPRLGLDSALGEEIAPSAPAPASPPTAGQPVEPPAAKSKKVTPKKKKKQPPKRSKRPRQADRNTSAAPPTQPVPPTQPSPTGPRDQLAAPAEAPLPAPDPCAPDRSGAPAGANCPPLAAPIFTGPVVPRWEKPLTPPRPSLLPPEAYQPGPTFLDQLADKIRALGHTAEAAHDSVERGILQQTVHLDNFFGNPNMEKPPGTSYHLIWRNSLRWQQGGRFDPGATVRADIDLTRINDRLNLIISGENEPDPIAPRLPQDPGNPGFDRTFQSARVVNTELRYQLRRTPTTYAFLGAGIEFAIPIQLFTRARYQYTYRIGELSLARMSETLFVKTKAGLGETTEVILERSLDPKTLLRWSNTGTVSQEIGAMEWGSELALLHELSSRSAITVAGGMFGMTSVNDWITNYVIYVRYRRNIWRPWLFYEVEPQVSWPRQADGVFPIVYAITGRLEIQFQGKETPGIKKIFR